MIWNTVRKLVVSAMICILLMTGTQQVGHATLVKQTITEINSAYPESVQKASAEELVKWGMTGYPVKPNELALQTTRRFAVQMLFQILPQERNALYRQCVRKHQKSTIRSAFKDLKLDDPDYTKIVCLDRQGIFHQLSPTRFAPDAPATVSDVLAMIVRIRNIKEAQNGSAKQWMIQKKLTSHDEMMRIGSDKRFSRGELAVLLERIVTMLRWAPIVDAKPGESDPKMAEKKPEQPNAIAARFTQVPFKSPSPVLTPKPVAGTIVPLKKKIIGSYNKPVKQSGNLMQQIDDAVSEALRR